MTRPIATVCFATDLGDEATVLSVNAAVSDIAWTASGTAVILVASTGDSRLMTPEVRRELNEIVDCKRASAIRFFVFITTIVVDSVRQLSYYSRVAKPKTPKPTEAELDVLRVLWERGPSTVAEIHEGQGSRGTGYTTTLKVLQRMTDKGLVVPDKSQRSHVYRAAVKAEKTQRQLVRDLVQRAFGGSPGQLVVQALSEQEATAEELAAIRELLDEMERKSKR